MNEFAKLAAEILSAVLPDSDLGKVVVLLLILLFLLIALGRLRLEWIGKGIRHIFRWLRCKTRDKHLYQIDGIIGWLDPRTGITRGRFVCTICGKRITVQ